MAAGIAWRVLRQSPGCLLEAHADAAHAAHLAEGRGDPQADAQLFPPMRRSRCSRSSSRAGLLASGQALLFLVGQEEDATVRAGRLRALAFADAGAGRAGLAEGRGSAHGTIIAKDRRPAPLRSVARERASALQRHLALLLQAAEDGVGDLHPLGIDKVATITRPRSRPGTNAT